MAGSGEVFVQQVGGADLDKAGGGAVGAGEPVALRDGPVHYEVNAGCFREDGAQDGGGADGDARERLKLFRRSEGDAGDAQGTAEVPGDERLVIRCNVQVECRLLAVAQEHSLDDADADFRVNMGTVLHGEARVGVHPFERDAQPVEGLIDLLLQRR